MRPRFVALWLFAFVVASTLIFSPSVHVAHAQTNGVVISAMYPGGGNPGATYTADYIEIFNAGTSPVDVTGWSVQYSNPVSAHWQKTFLPSVVLLPGQYLMARQDPGPNGTAEVPADAQGSAGMQGDGSFKVTIVRSRLTIHGHSPWEDASMTGRIEDFFGGGVANRWEAQAKSGTLDWTQAWFRHDGGCQDTDNNENDFYAGPAYPNARSMASPLNPCSGTELVSNGGFEDGAASWALDDASSVRCAGKGHDSDCALQLKATAKVTQAGHMAGLLSSAPSAAGDLLQISAYAKHKLPFRAALVSVTVAYASATAGKRGNGRDKLKLHIASTNGYSSFSKLLTLDDMIIDGKVVIKNSSSGKIFLDDVSVLLIAAGSGGPRALPPAANGVLPLPAAPDGFRGNN
jgi:hypothetical protein